ncbi:MAG: hypothetical protein AB7E80_10295 [Hyphomicrobiaceae bacterium]
MQFLAMLIFDWIFGTLFYAIGRGITRLFRGERSESGAMETLIGFALVLGLVVLLIKLPARLLFLAWGR